MSVTSENIQNTQVDSLTSKNINSLLSGRRSRCTGWKVLNSYLPQCPEKDFRKHCINWMNNCCKLDHLLEKKDRAANLLSNLFEMSSKYEELKQPVSFFIRTHYFDLFYMHFLDSEAGWNCTKTCMLYYKGACGAFQQGLEKHLTKKMKGKNPVPLIYAECFALLPSIGGGGNEGENYKINWKSQFMSVLNICHSILTDLYGDAEELKVQEYESLKFTDNKNAEYLVFVLHNYISILSCMLLNDYPAPKSIPSDLVFQLICRGLALKPKNLAMRQTTEFMALQEVLPQSHCSFLSLLKAVIVTCKSMLLPYSHLICKLIKQTLEWSQSGMRGTSNELLVELRLTAYETLCNWLSVARSGSCIEAVSTDVISNAMNDIKSKKKVVFLKGKVEDESREPTTLIVDATAKRRLCKAALKSLQFLLKFSGVSLSFKEHKETVVEMLLQIQKKDLMAPFQRSDCRLELYSLLLELVQQPCTKWPPPTHFALRLFSNGVNDCSPDVSSFCSSALNFLTTIIHPQYDNGGFFDASIDRGSKEAEITWTEESLHSGDEKVAHDISKEKIPDNNENSFESVGAEPAEKLNHSVEEQDVSVSSGEDSRVTVKYLKEGKPSEENVCPEEPTEELQVTPDLPIMQEQEEEEEQQQQQREQAEEEGKQQEKEEEKVMELENMVELEEEVVELEFEDVEGQVVVLGDEEEEGEGEELPSSKTLKHSMEEPPAPKKPRLSVQEPEVNETSSLLNKETLETTPRSRDNNKNSSDRSDLEIIDQESTSEERRPEKRYFLRSKKKVSSEESEENQKSGESPEIVKSTRSLAKSSLVAHSANRPKTRALSRIETNEAEEKSVEKNGTDDDDDEENLKKAFDDSLVD